MSSNPNTSPDSVDQLPPALPVQDFLLVFLTALAGVMLVINLLPMWLPGLTQSMAGDAPKAFWFLGRGSAVAAYWLLWLAMGMGVIMTNKMAKIWPGVPPAYEIHQYTSLLGLGFALFHALILMGDHYIKFDLFQVLVPFASANYKPVWVGLGQLAFYVWLVIGLSFYIRGRIGKKAWRLIHFASYASFIGVTVHGIMSGTDASAVWSYGSYWFAGGSLLFLTVYRVLNVVMGGEKSSAARAV
jgi:predicted ferric reductase